MNYYPLKICGLTRKLPIVALGPKIKIASFNLLGDGELVEKLTDRLAKDLRKLDFDYLVGPEVKVVPLIQALAKRLNKPRYIILRKNIMGYMTNPITNKSKPTLVLNGPDAEILEGKRVVIVDDVISTGHTIKVVEELMGEAGAKVVKVVAVFRQGKEDKINHLPFTFLGSLPVFHKK